MNAVYLVTKGRYSDYSVYGVFADKALAEEYAAQISDKWDLGFVSERKIMSHIDLLVPQGFRGYYVLMDRNGNSKKIDITPATRESEDGDGYAEAYYSPEKSQCILTGEYNFYVLTNKGEEGAIKIANERRIRMISENNWPEAGKSASDWRLHDKGSTVSTALR